MNAEPIGQNGRRLKTWKEIASFFGCDERTVRRWEETRELPVRRVPNSARSAVFAYECELRAWLNKEQPPGTDPGRTIGAAGEMESGRSWLVRRLAARWLFAVLALTLAGAAGALWFVSAQNGTGLGRHRPTPDAERFYQAGLYGWQSRTPAGLTQAVDDFTQAIVRDPQYAEAYAGLATCYNLLREYTAMPPDYAFPRAKAAAERAIALDPSLPDAHTALAFVDFYWLHNTAGARHEFQRAIALAPRNAQAHHWYATFLLNLREFPLALTEIEEAQQLDAESSSILADKGAILLYSGRTGEAAVLL
ncbi:MAG: tetratricopeptide repeat protein, partial [Sinobacteraceae bacterium]|nr:tetratricopeptide repeat protein [Nevskiaceae bacterium]